MSRGIGLVDVVIVVLACMLGCGTGGTGDGTTDTAFDVSPGEDVSGDEGSRPEELPEPVETAEPGPCSPSCGARDCGDDGCGGTCGHCALGQVCEGGRCTKPPGYCNLPEDCGDATLHACDPKTATCTQNGCNGDEECDEGETCERQNHAAQLGVCYLSCTGGGGECPPDWDCFVVYELENRGVCMPPGPGLAEKPCGRSMVSTGCERGYVCLVEAPGRLSLCRSQCAFFDEDPGCPDGQLCVFYGSCRSADSLDPAVVGEPCVSDLATWGTPCGDEGGRAPGLCLGSGSALSCQRVCRPELDDCPGEGICKHDYTSGLPFCLSEGGPCERVEDCSVPDEMRCEPSDGTCRRDGCYDTSQCESGEICLYQDPYASFGACYPACTSGTDEGCPEDLECVALDALDLARAPTEAWDYLPGAEGDATLAAVCLRPGQGRPWEPCSPSDIATGCVPGHQCTLDRRGVERLCLAPCEVGVDDPGCEDGQLCAYPGLCVPDETVIPAGIGDLCPEPEGSESSLLGESCASDGKSALGVCMEAGGGLRCRAPCHPELHDCREGEECLASYTYAHIPGMPKGVCASVGGPCRNAADCGTVSGLVCDPISATCSTSAVCRSYETSCYRGEICARQARDLRDEGACYGDCDPAEGEEACRDGGVCIESKLLYRLLGLAVFPVPPDAPQPKGGLCLPAGQGEAGGACEQSVVDTGCEGDLVCVRETSDTEARCRARCTVGPESQGCGEGLVCADGLCRDEAKVDPAALGASCEGAGAEEDWPCAPEDGEATGVCVRYGVALLCLEPCDMNAPTCGNGGVCARIGNRGRGLCVPAGGPCQTDSDCPPSGMGVCDPSSHACVYANCGDGLATCGRLKVCRPFIENGPVGICLTYCHDSSECPEGITCTHLQNTSMGLCLLAGKGNPDEACQPSPWTTGCAAGYRCVDDPTPLCRADCRPLAESRTCTSPTVCTVNGACEHTAEVDPASLGESCSPDSDMGTSCALEDGHSRGVCTFKIYQEYAVGPLCIELCHDTSGCPDGVSCTRGMVRDRDVGVCVNLSP